MATILIAADDEILRHLLGVALRRFDRDVIMPLNGRHVLNFIRKDIFLIRKDIFDLVILDESLQDKTVLEILRRMNGDSDLGVIYMILSSKSSTDIITGYVESGASDFVVKPFSLPKLLTRIEAILKPEPAPDVMLPKAS